MEVIPDENRFIQELKKLGRLERVMRPTRLIIQSFLAASEPISIRDIACAAKKYDPLVSFSTARLVMRKLVECGLVTEVKSDRHNVAARYTRTSLPEKTKFVTACNHRHVVCKECGAEMHINHSEQYHLSNGDLTAR